MIDDIFCKIINKELKADIIDETDQWMAVKDIHPAAPIHVLIFPKKHFQDLSKADNSDKELLGELLLATDRIANKLGLEKNGYRLIANKGEHGGQLVPHFHIHLLGGTRLGKKIIHDNN